MAQARQGTLEAPREDPPLNGSNGEHQGAGSSASNLLYRLATGIRRTQEYLMRVQQPDGHWVGELEGDSILQSEYILLLAYLKQHQTEHARKVARYLLNQQLPEGGWAQYPGGKIDISASVKAYFALKLTGYQPHEEPLQRARRAILSHGGADRVNSFTRFYLALLGQISYDECPAVPPEFLLAPKWFPVNVYSVSAWSRTIFVPLSIMSATRPVTNLPTELGIRELFLSPPAEWPHLKCPGLSSGHGLFSWDRFFRVVDGTWKQLQHLGLTPLRRRALRVAERWMLERFEESDGLGAIFPPMVWSIVALRCLGYADDSPEMEYCQERLSGLILEESETIRLQPCKSPVWDTSIALRALADSGVRADNNEICSSVSWLLEREVQREGDWASRVRCEPGGWYFEYANDFYPDLDDTAMVCMALSELSMDTKRGPTARRAIARRVQDALARAEKWMLSMQNRDGGWGAFDRDNTAEFLCHVPFADHNAMIDPSSPDLAARVLESLATFGHGLGHPAVDRSVAYLRKTQEADGSWFGRWGVNYIYGTWQVLAGLRAVGLPADDPALVAGAQWLLAHQQPSGGWGETADSYEDPSLRGEGPVTASQTAWALLGLLAVGMEQHPAVRRGMQYLLDTQESDGTWQETEFTGTGFPRVFYLRYHMYPIYFPLMALARWQRKVATAAELFPEQPKSRATKTRAPKAART